MPKHYEGYVPNTLTYLKGVKSGIEPDGRVLLFNGDYLYWQDLRSGTDGVTELDSDGLVAADRYALDQFTALKFNAALKAMVMGGVSSSGDPFAKGTRVEVVHPPTKGRSTCPAGSTGTINWHSDDGRAVGVDLDSETEIYAGKVKPRRIFVGKLRSDGVTPRVKPLPGITTVPDFELIRDEIRAKNIGLDPGDMARKWGYRLVEITNDEF